MTALIAWKPNCKDITTASFRFRALMPYQEMKKLGWPVEFFDLQNSHNYKVVIFQKAYTHDDVALACKLKKQGTIIVFDMCDNHFYNPLNMEKYTRRAQHMQSMVDIADHVIVSTHALSELINKEQVFQVDDYIDRPDNNFFFRAYNRHKLPRQFKKHGMADTLKLVWFGNAGVVSQDYGLKDIDIILPELEELNKHFPISLTIISNSKATYNEFVGNRQSFPTMYTNWRKHYFTHQLPLFDICLIPAGINPYTRVKTNNRVVLSLSLGIPIIATPLPSYHEFEPYIAFENWQENILKIATDPETAYKKVQAGQDYINCHYSIQAVTQQWNKLLSGLCLQYGITDENIEKLMTTEMPRIAKPQFQPAFGLS